ncbi:MAG: DUF1189 family protein [Patescibacteria group bacterium]|nr:DUF1189 family protein [Patescibacteria group bacterium]
MKKVKSFLFVLRNSFFLNRSFYKKISHYRFNFSFKYIISLILLLNFIFLSFWIWRISPNKINKISQSFINALKNYPDDLIIFIENNHIFSTYNQPYFSWWDYQNQKKLLFVVDENAEPQKIKIYNSLFLLTSKNLVIKSNNNQLVVLPLTYLSRFFNKKINKENVQYLIINLHQLNNSLVLIFFIIIVFWIFFSFLANFFYLILATFINIILYKLFFKKKLGFKKTLQVGFHAITFSLVLIYLFLIFSPFKLEKNLSNFKYFPVFFLICLLILFSLFLFTANYLIHLHKNDKI